MASGTTTNWLVPVGVTNATTMTIGGSGFVGGGNAACCAGTVAQTYTVDLPVRNAPSGTATSGRYEFALSDADVERIARRVAELLK